MKGLLTNYNEIFTHRGNSYHRAMELIPDARFHEFMNLFKCYKPLANDVIVDLPSGGNYLKDYLPAKANYIPLEITSGFTTKQNEELCLWSSLPLANQTADALISCAALHHVSLINRIQFFQEAYRVLKKDRFLIIADVEQGSPQDVFLNQFVNQYNSLGHEGTFIDHAFGQQLLNYGFAVEQNECIAYPWELSDDEVTSLQFIQLLFGLDLADYQLLQEVLTKYLGFRKNANLRWQIDWKLRFITCKKES